jgi:acyl-CoA thioesterase-1
VVILDVNRWIRVCATQPLHKILVLTGPYDVAMTVGIRVLLGVSGLAIGAILLAGCAASRVEGQGTASAAPATTGSASAATSPGTSPSASAPAAAPMAVMIGDSIMNGYGLAPEQAWPTLVGDNLHWTVASLACDGAGFDAIGFADGCGDNFSGMVVEAASLHPQIVIISGSSNDLGADSGQLIGQTKAVLNAIRAALPDAIIYGISPVWNDTAVPAQLTEINSQVRQAITDVRGTYVEIGQPLAGHREWVQDDDVHPTAKGQQVIATAIESALSAISRPAK